MQTFRVDRPVDAEPRAASASSQMRKLTQFIHKSPEEWTVEDLYRFCRENEVHMLSLMHIGGDGWLKTLDFVPRDEQHFRDIVKGGERADGSSLFANSGIQAGKSDILLRPRVESAFLDPFAESPVLVLLCGHRDRDGNPLSVSPDTIVRRAYARVEELTGTELYAHGEVEYYLGKRPDDSDAFGAKDHGYHAASPFVFGEALRREALLILAEMGVPIKYGHSEVGYLPVSSENDLLWEQHEIETALQPLPLAAESVVLTQWVLRNLAQQQGYRCSFAPVIVRGHAGTGMHFHLAPYRNHGIVAPFDTAGSLTDPARWLIGGLTKYGGTLMAFGNTADTSLLRLSQAKEAPNSVTWGQFNRQALVRVPMVVKDESGREMAPPTIEFRLADGSAHPHLLLAGIAQAAVAAKSMPELNKWIEHTSVEKSADSEAPAVPKSRDEIAAALKKDRTMLEAGNVFPAGLIERLIQKTAKHAT